MTKEKFEVYEEIRESGETNMFDVKTVIQLSGEELNKEDIADIMKNYNEYTKKFK